jgi:hypothetical protein
MKRLALVAIVVSALVPGCKKSEKSAEPAATPAPTASTASTASGSAAPPAATPPTATPPAAAPPDAPPPLADAPPPPSDAAPAAPADPLTSVCPKLLAKIEECVDDKDFVAALMKDADAKKKKLVKRLLAEVADWTANPCADMAASYEYQGFTNKWDKVSDPAILENCAKLGEAVHAAGGLFGGDQAM